MNIKDGTNLEGNLKADGAFFGGGGRKLLH